MGSDLPWAFAKKRGWSVCNLPALFVRPLGHILFFWFLAAAAWVDIRYRVIPDVITTPGVLCGLVALVIFPGILLPVPVITERSFAPATLTADFLVAWGALNNSKAVESSISHVGVTMALFCCGGLCAPPWTQQNNEYSRAFVPRVIQFFREPRNLTLLFGITVLSFANWWGGLLWQPLRVG